MKFFQKKSILILLAVFIACSYLVSADNVSYILKHPSLPEQKYIDILTDMGFTVNLIDDDDVPNINFSNFEFSLIGDGFLKNANLMPVNEYPSLIVNRYNLDDFHWSSSSATLVSSGLLQVYVNDVNNTITENFTDIVDVYTTLPLSYLYLPKNYKSPWLKTVASLTSDHADAVIATAEPGTRLRDGIYSNAKGVFFGIDRYLSWTNYSEEMFRKKCNLADNRPYSARDFKYKC